MHAKVDIIYTWVDGTDPVWRARREKAAKDNRDAPLLTTANVEGRFRDNNELQYSLKALETYFPDHGRVFLVTDKQKPRWLGEFPHVTVVDHSDILDPDGMPAFSSMNIESCLHRIEGLSEYYLYFNDDMFLCRNVTAKDFFTEYGVLFNASGIEVPENTDGSEHFTAPEAAAQSIRWLEAQGYCGVNRNLPGHSPMPVIKDTMIEMEHVWPELFRQSRLEQFRCRGSFSLVSDLYYRWMIATGRGRMALGRSIYFETGASDFESSLYDFGQRSKNSPILSFCINDTHDNQAPQQMISVIALMRKFFAMNLHRHCS